MTTLSTALQTATTGSIELDAMIAREWLGWTVTQEDIGPSHTPRMQDYWWSVNGDMEGNDPLPWSTDLTACVALVQEKLPGWKWGVHGAAKEFEAYCIRMPSASGPAVIGRLYKENAPIPCLALLRALDAALREVENHA